MSMVSAADFSDQRIGKAVEGVAALFKAGRPVGDVRLLEADLLQMGVDPEFANRVQLTRMVVELGSGGAVGFHAERIRDKSRLRRMFDAAARFRDRVTAYDSTPDDVLSWLEGQMLTLRHGAASTAKPIDEVFASVISDMQSRVGTGDRQVLLSGLPCADSLGFVFGPGELSILAARPGVGKTSLATQIAMHHAAKGRAVLMASLEMNDRELGSRLLVASAGHNHQTIRMGRIDQGIVDDLQAAKEDIGKVPFYVWSPGRVKAGVIHAAAAVLKASQNIQLLIVDYLGLVKADDYSRARHEQVGMATKALRDIGQQLQIPVLVLCQLNREAATSRPRLDNLRESGDIEQDADIVAFLHREEDVTADVELIVEKNRQGGIGSTKLLWRAEQTRFEDTRNFTGN